MYQGIYQKPIEQEEKVIPMDVRVLRWITVLSGLLVLLAGACLSFLPELREREVFAVETLPPWDLEEIWTEEEAPAKEEIRGGELVVATTPDKVVEAEENLKAQISIDLPPDLTEDALLVQNDYLNQTVYVRLATDAKDYFAEYGIRGRSDNIASLSYYADGTEGVIALGLDKICEQRNFVEDGKLYMDLIDPHESYDKVIVVDAGHGGKIPGAVKNGLAEKDVNLAILMELKQLLDEDDSICAFYTRTTDVNPALEQRVELANRLHADLFISVHNNSSMSGEFTKTNGTMVLYQETDESEFSSERLARICQDCVVEALGSRDMGLFAGNTIHIIRNSEVPVALIEVGYMTNREELDKLGSDDYQKKAAAGIYRAIRQAFEEGF